MGKTRGTASYYAAPADYLQQGDIFRINIVAPAADEEARIFRTHDGRHGSAVFEERCEARVFGDESLRQLLDALSRRSGLHTEPFTLTDDGQGEMVVVYARLFRYFIIASHTCDISGQDEKPLPWTTILPVFTLAEVCRTEKLPFRSQGEPMTIEAFLSLGEPGAQLRQVDETRYAEAARQAVKTWIESGLSGKLLEDARKVRNYLNQYHNKGFLFCLPVNEHFSLPESCVDFSAAFTVLTVKLDVIKGCRIARIDDPYRMSFSKRFADLLGRPTLPAPMAPDTSV